MRIPQAEIDRIKASVSCAGLLAERGHEMRRSGANWTALCPFRDEKTPSFYIYEAGHCHCYGCGEHVKDVFHLVQKLDGLSFADAARKLGANATEEGPRRRKVKRPPRPAPEAPPFLSGDALELASRAVQNLREHPAPIESWARERGWRPEVLRELNAAGELGFLDGKWCFVSPWGVKLRWGREFITRGAAGLWRAARLEGARRVLITEGETDAISILSHRAAPEGFLVVASPGTSFPAWAPPLFRGKETVLCFDADEAGKTAAARAAKLLKSHVSLVGTLNLSKLL